MKQLILTPCLTRILGCLIDQQKKGNEIVSVCPHYDIHGNHSGYIVIVNEKS